MKYYNYTKVGTPATATDIPLTPNLFWEIDASAGKLLAVLEGEADDVQSSDDKGVTWVVEVTGAAVFIESWHDRSNELIYLIEQDGVNNAETYVVDYSNWAAISLTKHNGNLGTDIQNVYNTDIFLRDGNLEVIVCDGNQIDARRYNDPWASIDINGDNVNSVSCVVVVGTVAYFYGDINGGNTVGMYSFDGATVDTLDTIAATSTPTTPPGTGTVASKNMAYDGDDTIYFIAKDDGTGDNYLYSYGITADIITKRGQVSYFLMRDRDTESGIKEKAWDFNANGFSVYQLHDVIKYQLHKIARPAITTDYKIYAVTDNFLWAAKLNGAWASEIWEYENQLDFLKTLMIHHQVQEASECQFTLVKDTIPIEKNLFVRFLHEFTTAAGVPILYRGTYNFKDDTNGDEPAGWTTNNDANCTTTVISDLDGHKKVLQLFDDSNVGDCEMTVQFSKEADTTVEFWIQQDSVAANTIFKIFLFEDASFKIYILWENDDIKYNDGAWHDLKLNCQAADEWYHIKIVCDDSANTYDFYLDGILEGDNLPYRVNTTTGLNKIQINTDNADNGYNIYIDALGISTDPDYTVGDNIMEEAEEEIVFEGIIIDFTEMPNQTVWCVSLAKRELKVIKPSGDYTVDSDGLVSDLITDFCSYITEGTLTDGADLGTISLGGNQTLETILDDCAEFEGWIWYLTPTGVLYFNNGTVDSTINYTEANDLVSVTPSHTHEEFNKIKVRGAYVDGVQVESVWQEDIASQQRIGINERIIDVTFLNTVALCNFAAANLLTILAKDPKKVGFALRDTTTGMIQVGETITFKYSDKGIVIVSDQYLIRNVIITKFGITTYTIMDELS